MDTARDDAGELVVERLEELGLVARPTAAKLR